MAMVGLRLFLAQYGRCCPLFPVQSMELPTTDGKWRRRHSLQSHKGGTWSVCFIFNVSVSGAGCCLSVSRQGGQSPRYRKHAHGADAVSTGLQQARNTEGSERTATVGPHREPGVCPRSTS